ncbi:MAG: hypothetical protein IIA78_03575 [Proteobacteria bacterium]|nr:hypothetical protein [Pseudomonadota bacterium]
MDGRIHHLGCTHGGQGVQGVCAGHDRDKGEIAGGVRFDHTLGESFYHDRLAGVVVVYVTLTIPQAILVESFLSFLGLGIQEPQTSLGALVDAGVNQIERASWTLLIPATLLAMILLCFNFLGDGLRDLLDARQTR